MMGSLWIRYDAPIQAWKFAFAEEIALGDNGAVMVKMPNWILSDEWRIKYAGGA